VFHVGDAVRKVRRQQRISLRKMGNLTGLDKGTISAFERGKKTTEIKTMEMLAVVLGMHPSKLYENVTDLAQPEPHARGEPKPNPQKGRDPKFRVVKPQRKIAER
jgi:transcriptional regulator with XRE-family HTH domain